MVKINYLLELLDLQSSSCKPEVAASGFPFDPFKKADITIVQGMKRKISLSFPQDGKDRAKVCQTYAQGYQGIKRIKYIQCVMGNQMKDKSGT